MKRRIITINNHLGKYNNISVLYGTDINNTGKFLEVIVENANNNIQNCVHDTLQNLEKQI